MIRIITTKRLLDLLLKERVLDAGAGGEFVSAWHQLPDINVAEHIRQAVIHLDKAKRLCSDNSAAAFHISGAEHHIAKLATEAARGK